MYGSSRPKRTMLAFNAKEFGTINKLCCGVSASHRHEKWGIHVASNQFATALETAYPVPLARAIAAQFAIALQRRGIKMLPETLSAIGDLDNNNLALLRAQAGVQPKASRLPPLIATFAAKVALSGFQADLPQMNLHQKLANPLQVATTNAPTTLPKGSKLLQIIPSLLPSSCLQGGAFVSEKQLEKSDVDRIVSAQQDMSSDRTGTCETQVWGVPWSEDSFLEQMVKFGHPATVKNGLPGVLQETMEYYKATTTYQRVDYRASRLGVWLRRMAELKGEETKMKGTMDSDVALVLKHKNILLWEEMLTSLDYPDMGVVNELREGTDLVGRIAKTGLWPPKFQPACVTLDELKDIACRERDGLNQQFLGLGDVDLMDQVWNKTMDEVAAGILVGPIPLDQIPAEFPLSRRFGIKQGSKVRCIDDFPRSSVNSSVQACESPKPHTVDVFAAMCVHLMSELEEGEQWVGRTFDLVGAYRQCAVKPSSKSYSYIVVQKPGSGDLVGFRMRALPFGSICSVHAFLRISHSIWFILVKEFRVLMTNYFDDFISLSPKSESPAVMSCIHMCFKLLGWAFAETGEKAPDFSAVFQALGVSVDVSNLHRGVMEIANTENRRQELLAFLRHAIQTRRLTKQEALRLRGRLQFSAGQLFGRIAKSALAAISNHAYMSTNAALSDDTVDALVMHAHLLDFGKPRVLRASSATSWYIQTDACFESGPGDVMAGIGAVLFNPCGKPVKFFSHKLSQTVVSAINPDDKRTAIYECEFFSLFCAFLSWGSLITDAVVIYTDNNGVRDTLIACTTRNAVARKILTATLALESMLQLTPWYARVPTDSNLSDGPSRFCCEELLATGAMQCGLDGDKCWAELISISERWGEQQALSSPKV